MIPLALALLAAAAPVGAAKAGTRPAASAPAARAVAPADTTSPPSFAGTWKLSIERSVFGKIPGGQPAARTDVIQHDGARIRQTLHLLNGTRRDTTIYLYSTDGTPTVNQVDGRDIRSTVTWEGRALHLVSTTRLLILDMSLDERWRLTPDGRTLTMTRHVKWGIGEGDQTLVFDRQ